LERKYVMAWLDGLPKPVGIMTCNDVRGMQVLESCAARSIPVPDEVAVVGADDDQLLCDLSNPSLSSVSWNLEKAGFRAAELLDAMMTGKKVPSRRIDVEPLWVTARQSTDAVAVEDRDVAAALRFIRQNANRPIGVNHVVAQVAISRRSLEMRFENCLGRTIRAEIERMRIARTKRLLQETDMAIAKIADAAGFSSLSYLCKVFRRETGETPAQYRRRNRVS
jgi:LacI family transcriptional regulator